MFERVDASGITERLLDITCGREARDKFLDGSKSDKERSEGYQDEYSHAQDDEEPDTRELERKLLLIGLIIHNHKAVPILDNIADRGTERAYLAKERRGARGERREERLKRREKRRHDKKIKKEARHEERRAL